LASRPACGRRSSHLRRTAGWHHRSAFGSACGFEHGGCLRGSLTLTTAVRLGGGESPAWLRHQGQRSLGSAMGGRKEAGSGKSRSPCGSTATDPPSADHQLRGAADFRRRSAQHARRLDDLAIRRPRPRPIGRRSDAFFTSERPDRLCMCGRPRTDHAGAAPFEAVGMTQSAHARSLGFYLK
jgi:hypothetical protein